MPATTIRPADGHGAPLFGARIAAVGGDVEPATRETMVKRPKKEVVVEASA